MKGVYRAALGILATLAGCTGVIDDRPGSGGDALAGPSLVFTAPAPHSVYLLDQLDELGALTAIVDLRVDTTGIDEVVFSNATGGELDGIGGPQLDGFLAAIREPGAHTLIATGFAGGQEVASASVDITVEAPAPADCHEWLDLYQLDYELGPSRQGVADPVTVTTPINGITHRYVSNTTPRATFFMDCTLALSLARAASHLRRRDIVEVADIGVYNYRCIGGGTPPDCPNGVSQHAYATALDIAGYTTSDGTYYSVNDDWVIDPSGEPTCTAATEGFKDALLHEVICELKAAGVWNIVLTPNYNAAHRNHFHVDLTPGANFIRSRRAVDSGPDRH